VSLLDSAVLEDSECCNKILGYDQREGGEVTGKAVLLDSQVWSPEHGG